jgi:hypothetical protein
MSSTSNHYLKSIIGELNLAKINFLVVQDKIHVPLPNNFDTLVIEIWNEAGEDSITLLDGDYHSHGDIEAREFGFDTREKGIRNLIECIFDGTFKMVRRPNASGDMENTIWDTFSLASIDKRDHYEIVQI